MCAVSVPHALPALDKPDAELPKEIVWMPAGKTSIVASTSSGKSWEGTVVCDQAAFEAVVRDFTEARAGGARVWIDESHNDEKAVADITGFRWDPAVGIVAAVNWTPYGERLLRERQYHSFSPSFFANKDTGRVAGLVTGFASGGLTNSPAFGSAMPALIAARMAGTSQPAGAPGTSNTKTESVMKDQLIKILASFGVTPPADANDEQLLALVAEHAGKNNSAADAAIKALKAELETLKASMNKPEDVAAIQAMKTELEAIKTANAAARKAKAVSAVQAAVARGAIKPEDKAMQEKWEKLITADESHIELLAAMPGVKTAASEADPLVVVGDAVQAAKTRGATEVEITEVGLREAIVAYSKTQDAKKRQEIFAKAINPRMDGGRKRVRMGEFFQCKNGGDLTGGHLIGPILAANSLGTLAPELVLQRTLVLLKLSFPLLTMITTDFSDQPAKGGAAIKTRTRSIPSVSQRHATNGYATTINAATADVSVTLAEQPFYVQMAFNTVELGSTNRDLFGEQVEGCHYAIGKDFVDAIYEVLSVANFANETVAALNSFDRTDMRSGAKALNIRGVPRVGRFALLNADYFEQLGNDEKIMLLAAYREPEMIHEYGLPRVAGFAPIEAINLPADPDSEGQDLAGFFGTTDSLVIVSRPPANYNTALPGGGNGSVSTVTNPDVGISVQLAQYVDHVQGASIWRAAYLRGENVGQAASGQRLVTTATSS